MEPSGQSQRWQGQRSTFPWEQEALDYIQAQMPDAPPYWAHQVFTFTAFSAEPSLITNYSGAPTQTYGQCYHDHLVAPEQM